MQVNDRKHIAQVLFSTMQICRKGSKQITSTRLCVMTIRRTSISVRTNYIRFVKIYQTNTQIFISVKLSSVKSVGYKTKDKPMKYNKEPTVAIYCRIKGDIPYGKKMSFQKRILGRRYLLPNRCTTSVCVCYLLNSHWRWYRAGNDSKN